MFCISKISNYLTIIQNYVLNNQSYFNILKYLKFDVFYNNYLYILTIIQLKLNFLFVKMSDFLLKIKKKI